MKFRRENPDGAVLEVTGDIELFQEPDVLLGVSMDLRAPLRAR